MAAFAPPYGRGYPLGVSVPLLRYSLASGRRLRQKLLRCIAHRARSQFLPWASFYSLSEPTAWPPALRKPVIILQAQTLIDDYIAFYNHDRIQLNSKFSPIEKRRLFA